MKNNNLLLVKQMITCGLTIALLTCCSTDFITVFNFINLQSVYAQENSTDYKYFGMTAQQIYDDTKAEWEAELEKVTTYYKNHPRDVLEIKSYYKPEDLNLKFFQAYLKYRNPTIALEKSSQYGDLNTELSPLSMIDLYSPLKALCSYSYLGVGGIFGPTSPDIYRAQRKYKDINDIINLTTTRVYEGNYTDEDIKTYHNQLLDKLSSKETYAFSSQRPNTNKPNLIIEGRVQRIANIIEKDGIVYAPQLVVESTCPDYLVYGGNGYITVNNRAYIAKSEIPLSIYENKITLIDIKELCALLNIGYAYDEINKVIHVSSKGLPIPEQRSKEVFVSMSYDDGYQPIVEGENPSIKINWGTYEQIKSLPDDMQKFFSVSANGGYIKSNLMVGLWQSHGDWANCYQNYIQHPTMAGTAYNPVASMYLWNEVNKIRQERGLKPYKWAYDLLPITIGNGIAQPLSTSSALQHIVGWDALGGDSRNDWINAPKEAAERMVKLWLGSGTHADILLNENAEYACCSAGANGTEVFQIWEGYYNSDYKKVTPEDINWLNGIPTNDNIFEIYVKPHMIK